MAIANGVDLQEFVPAQVDQVYLEKLRRQAYKTAQNYSWQKITATTLALYAEARHLKETRQL